MTSPPRLLLFFSLPVKSVGLSVCNDDIFVWFHGAYFLVLLSLVDDGLLDIWFLRLHVFPISCSVS